MTALGARLVLAALSASVLASCNQHTEQVLDACQAIQRGEELVGVPIRVRAWHGAAGYWGALGSGECENLIYPDFDGSFDVTTDGPADAETRRLVRMLQEKPVIVVPFDFQAEFEGVLEKRTGDYPTRPVPLHSPPPMNEMPYVLHVTAIRGLRIVADAPWQEAPPPPPPPENG